MKKRLKLKELEVSSFVTNLEEHQNNVLAGTGAVCTLISHLSAATLLSMTTATTLTTGTEESDGGPSGCVDIRI